MEYMNVPFLLLAEGKEAWIQLWGTQTLTPPPKEANPFLIPTSGPPIHLCQQQHLWNGVTNISSDKSNPDQMNNSQIWFSVHTKGLSTTSFGSSSSPKSFMLYYQTALKALDAFLLVIYQTRPWGQRNSLCLSAIIQHTIHVKLHSKHLYPNHTAYMKELSTQIHRMHSTSEWDLHCFPTWCQTFSTCRK